MQKKHAMVLLSVVLMLGILSACVPLQSTTLHMTPAVTSGPIESETHERAEAREALHIGVGGEVFAALADETAHHLQNARRDLAAANADSAAAQLTRAGAFIKLEVLRLSAHPPANLWAAINEIDDMALRVSKKEVTDVAALDKTIARTEYALAQFYLQTAQQASQQGDHASATLLLRNAVAHTEQLAAQMGNKPQADVKKSFDEIHVLAAGVIGGALGDKQAFDDHAATVDREIEVLGQKVEAATTVSEPRPLQLFDIMNIFAEEPEYHFDLARKDLNSGLLVDAGIDIETSVAFLRLEAARAPAAAKISLKASIAELYVLAEELMEGNLVKVAALDHAVAQAEYALASNQYQLALQTRSDGESVTAGRFLGGAIYHLAVGDTLTRYAPADEVIATLEQAFNDGGTQAGQAAVDAAEFQTLLDAVGQEIRRAVGAK